MLEIINGDGMSMELGDDTRVVVERSNPLFIESENFFQDITYPGKAPLTHTNKRFVANGHLVETSNSTYELPATVIHAGKRLFEGVMRYKIMSNEIDFIIMFNWGLVADKAKETLITDIEFQDGVIHPGTEVPPPDAMNTLVNPGDYNYAYFPVRARDHILELEYMDYFINPFDYQTQSFKNPGGPVVPPYGTHYYYRWSPHFKLTYVFEVVMRFLGFEPQGTFWEDPRFENIYIHSEMFFNRPRPSTNNYLPAILVSDFINQVKNRYNLSIVFDGFENTVSVDAALTIISQHEVLDLTDYISQYAEIKPPEQKGYSVTLSPWQADEYFKDQLDNPTPVFSLNVGQKENKIEIPITTLTQSEDPTYGYQYVITGVSRETIFGGQTFFPGSTTPKISPSLNNVWPIRLVRYVGQVPVESGKWWPQTESVELTEDEGMWYRFLNDTKSIRATAYVPTNMLSRLKVNKLVGLRSPEGFYYKAIVEQYMYQLGRDATEYVQVEIICRPIVVPEEPAIISVIPLSERPENSVFAPVKALFDENIYSEINFEANIIMGSSTIPGQTFGDITKSVEPRYFTGGSESFLVFDGYEEGDTPFTIPWSLQIKLNAGTYSKPKLHIGGMTINSFTSSGGFWTVSIPSANYTDSGATIIIDLT